MKSVTLDQALKVHVHQMKNKGTLMKLQIFATVLLLAHVSWSQSTAQSGLDKLKANLDNSKANLAEYQKNLKIVDGNISEVAKAKSQVEEQQKQISAQLKENTIGLQKVQKSEDEVQKMIKDEESKALADEKKVKDLQALIQKLEENKTKRDQNLQNYKVQLSQAQQERKVWEQRALALKEQEKQVLDRSKTVNTQEAEWKNKKRGYEGEVSRWNKEIEKQQKNYSQFKDLSEAKK